MPTGFRSPAFPTARASFSSGLSLSNRAGSSSLAESAPKATEQKPRPGAEDFDSTRPFARDRLAPGRTNARFRAQGREAGLAPETLAAPAELPWIMRGAVLSSTFSCHQHADQRFLGGAQLLQDKEVGHVATAQLASLNRTARACLELLCVLDEAAAPYGRYTMPLGWKGTPPTAAAATAPVFGLIVPKLLTAVQVAGAELALHGVTAV